MKAHWTGLLRDGALWVYSNDLTPAFMIAPSGNVYFTAPMRSHGRYVGPGRQGVQLIIDHGLSAWPAALLFPDVRVASQNAPNSLSPFDDSFSPIAVLDERGWRASHLRAVASLFVSGPHGKRERDVFGSYADTPRAALLTYLDRALPGHDLR